MATRDVMDNRIDVWKDVYKDDQQLWRVTMSTTGNYGQVLRGNGRPSDQLEDGPLLPPLLKDEGWIDVYEAPDGFGWTAWFEATEGADVYHRTLGSHEDDPLVETAWVLWVDPLAPETLLASMWSGTKRFASATWRVLNTPIGDLWRA